MKMKSFDLKKMQLLSLSNTELRVYEGGKFSGGGGKSGGGGSSGGWGGNSKNCTSGSTGKGCGYSGGGRGGGGGRGW
jgi:hypothetical protein